MIHANNITDRMKTYGIPIEKYATNTNGTSTNIIIN